MADARLIVMYENVQEWLRHYQNAVLAFNGLALTVEFAFFAYGLSGSRAWPLALSVLPLAFAMLTILVTALVNTECKRAFRRLVEIEAVLGFYEMEGPTGEPLLPQRYRSSAIRTQPLVLAVLLAQALVICVAILFPFVGVIH